MALTKIDLNNQVQGTLPASSLPAPTSSTLGGVESLTPVANSFLTGISTAGIPTYSQPSFSNLSGTLTASQLPAPTASTLGGVESLTPVANSFLTGISTAGVPTYAQPSFSNISGTATPAQLPTATTSSLGVVEPDGTTITIASGVISAAGVNFSYNEVPTGTINGTNATFTLAHTPKSGIVLNLNGVTLQPGTGNDYTISGVTITMLTIPLTNDKLVAAIYNY